MVETPLVRYTEREDLVTFTHTFVMLLDDTVLDFHKQDTLHRLIDTVQGQLALLHSLLERCDHGGNLTSAIWPLNQIVTSNDREHSSLAQCPSSTYTLHIKTIGNHHSIITQLISKEMIDGLLRKFGWKCRINCRHQYIRRHYHGRMILLDH